MLVCLEKPKEMQWLYFGKLNIYFPFDIAVFFKIKKNGKTLNLNCRDFI
jgi:hypothetical protein